MNIKIILKFLNLEVKLQSETWLNQNSQVHITYQKALKLINMA